MILCQIFPGGILVLACRDVSKALNTKVEILQKLGEAGQKTTIHVRCLDLNSFDSIVKFVESIDSEFKEVYALVNNAGVFYHPQQLTEDGFDVTFQTNYLGELMLIK